jgi:copper homeostasis protein CutC
MPVKKRDVEKIKKYNEMIDRTKKSITKIKNTGVPKNKLKYLSPDDKETLNAIDLHSSLAITGLKELAKKQKITDEKFDESISTIINLYKSYIDDIKEDVDEAIENERIYNNKDHLKDYR